MSVLRTASLAFKAAMTSRVGNSFAMADLFVITLLNGTIERYTSWPTVLTIGGNLYSPALPWLKRGKWNLTNTMEVPTMEVFILDNEQRSFGSNGFGGGVLGGPKVREACQQGIFDGATLLYSRVYMPTPGDVTTWGTVDIFSGDMGAAQIQGAGILIKVRAKNSRLNTQLPRNTFQPGCVNTFCDAICTLSLASFTATYTVQASPTTTTTVIAWTAPGSPALSFFVAGTVTFSGVSPRSIIAATSTTLTLAYPLPAAPVPGQTFAVAQGCDKTMATCTSRSNLLNFRGFPFVPPPDTRSP